MPTDAHAVGAADLPKADDHQGGHRAHQVQAERAERPLPQKTHRRTDGANHAPAILDHRKHLRVVRDDADQRQGRGKQQSPKRRPRALSSDDMSRVHRFQSVLKRNGWSHANSAQYAALAIAASLRKRQK